MAGVVIVSSALAAEDILEMEEGEDTQGGLATGADPAIGDIRAIEVAGRRYATVVASVPTAGVVTLVAVVQAATVVVVNMVVGTGNG